MTDMATTTYRSVLAMQALSTMGVEPNWDALVGSLLRFDTLARAEEEYGPTSIRSGKRDIEVMMAEQRYGKNYAQHPEVQPMFERHKAECAADDDLMSREYYQPLWKAQRELALATPPTLSAALFKATLIEVAELWNDSVMDADCMEIVRTDLARFSGADCEHA